MMDLGISGRRAAVAAASAGLGLAIASALRQAGVHVVICGRDEARLVEAAERIGAYPLVADVSNAEGGRDFVDRAAAVLGGPLDILVPNAGGPPIGPVESIDPASLTAAIDLNLQSTVAMCAAAVGPMRSNQWGRIMAITSITSRQPIPSIALSNITRPAVTGYLKTLAMAVAADGVTVNSLQPGLHATARGGSASHAVPPGIPAGVVGRPEDFGHVGAFLCSEHARYITGVGLPVDGGWTNALQ